MHLYHLAIGIFVFLFTNSHAAYNPIPIGSVIISTRSRIDVMQPKEYGGRDVPKTIYTAPMNVTILYSIYDSLKRDLYILYTNATNGAVYLSQLALIEQLDSSVYQLPITFNISMVNQYSFSSDIVNRRVFLTDDKGIMTLFSMSGLLTTTISSPITTAAPIRSVAYNSFLNRFFFITDTTVNSCVSTNNNTFQCCEAVSRGIAFRSIEFDQIGSDTYVYVLDQKAGIYQVSLNATGCPTALRLTNTMTSDTNLHFTIDRGLYFESGSARGGSENSNLYAANGTALPREIPIGQTIVALDISMPLVQPTFTSDGTCFHGVSYSTYRAAVILAAIFGTIMGIFMCFNVLFCIDFFMTKRIIHDLKQQIPHNLLEDRWNKLIEEKYAKIALERNYSFFFFFFIISIFRIQVHERKMIHLHNVNPLPLVVQQLSLPMIPIIKEDPTHYKYQMRFQNYRIIFDVRVKVI